MPTFGFREEWKIARLSTGSLEHYDVCGTDFERTQDLLRAGAFRWKYLGQGEIFSINGYDSQGRIALRTLPRRKRRPADTSRPLLPEAIKL